MVKVFFLSVLAACHVSCVIPVSTCYPLAAKQAGRCPANEDWRMLMQDLHENGMCAEGEPQCCEVDGRWCCLDGDEIACSR